MNQSESESRQLKIEFLCGTESEESIRERLEIARNELAQQDKFTLKLVNDEVNACAARLYDVICQRAGLTR